MSELKVHTAPVVNVLGGAIAAAKCERDQAWNDCSKQVKALEDECARKVAELRADCDQLVRMLEAKIKVLEDGLAKAEEEYNASCSPVVAHPHNPV